jgi:hypothetical protein
VPSDGRSETPAVYTKETSFGKQRSLVSKTFLPRGVRLQIELVSTRDPAHVPVVIRGTTTRRKNTQCRRYQHDSPTDTQCRQYQQAVEHELVSTRDPAHVPVVIQGTWTRPPTCSSAPYQQALEHELVSTRDPAHVLVVMRRTTTRRPTHSAAGISRQQNTSWSQRETQLMSWS